MLKGPFGVLAAFLLWTVVCTVFLPLAMFIGYPWLLALGVWYVGRWYGGHLNRPGQIAAVWAAYLGLILILHGIVICFDSALAGTPTIEQKRFGNRLAYVGGAVAGVAVVFAYAIDLRQRAVKMEAVKPNPLDDLAA